MAQAGSNSSAQNAQANTIEMQQPGAKQTMQPMMPNPDQTSEQRDAQAQKEEQVMRLRGGEACPGRFCFIIPCPIPCNFCVFPCPC